MLKCRPRFPLMLTIAAVILLADRLTKLWVLRNFELGESRPVTDFLYWTYVHNTGTAFGMFQGNNRLLFIIAVAILAALLYSARGLCERGGRWAFWGVALVLGGAVGNLVDRLLYGQVIDFIDFRVWPVFNIADSAITVGACSLAIGLWKDSNVSHPA